MVELLPSVFCSFTFVLCILQGVDAALDEDQVTKALILSLRLNEDSLIRKCIFAVNSIDIPVVASSIPNRYLERLIEVFAHLLEKCPHLEFILRWCQVYFLSFLVCSFLDSVDLLHCFWIEISLVVFD